ncbi:MAG: DUF4214 domain-containing protein [Acidimicrobiales bacterium]
MFTLVAALLVTVGPLPAEAARVNPVETSTTCSEIGAHTGRLYRAMFGRPADRPGLLYWVGQRYRGQSGEQVAYWMGQGAEFHALYDGLDDGSFVAIVYRNLLGRAPDRAGQRYWGEMVITHGRYNVLSWMVGTPEFALVWPYATPPLCPITAQMGLSEARPGIWVGRSGDTVTVVADRALVDFRATAGPPTFATGVPGDVVVNANWFTVSGPIAPLVAGGRAVGGPDISERGQIVSWRPGCGGHDGALLEHVWTWRIFTPDACTADAVSGVSLIHKGVRADAYPGVDLTSGPTNADPSHSFLGFNDNVIVVIASHQLPARHLADYALSLGVTEGVMLDGGTSTQIRTPFTTLSTDRPVPAFAVLDSRAR